MKKREKLTWPPSKLATTGTFAQKMEENIWLLNILMVYRVNHYNENVFTQMNRQFLSSVKPSREYSNQFQKNWQMFLAWTDNIGYWLTLEWRIEDIAWHFFGQISLCLFLLMYKYSKTQETKIGACADQMTLLGCDKKGI